MKNRIESVYKKTERFAEVTKRMIISGNMARAKKMMAVAEQLFVNDKGETKSAISNIYVHSISTFLEIRRCSIANLFPKNLRAEYLRQINSTSV